MCWMMAEYLSQKEVLERASRITPKTREIVAGKILSCIPLEDKADLVIAYVYGFFVGEHYEGTMTYGQNGSAAQIHAPHFEYGDVAEAVKRLKNSGWDLTHYVIGNEIAVQGISADLGRRLMKALYPHVTEKRIADIARSN